MANGLQALRREQPDFGDENHDVLHLVRVLSIPAAGHRR